MAKQPDPLKRLPPAARAYVVSVIATGAAFFAFFVPQARFDQPGMFAALLLLAVVTATFKVYLPLPRGTSTMSVSYAVDFASLLLLGPHETMVVAAVSVFCQCNLNTRVKTPLYRTMFSMASVVITIWAAGLVFERLGGSAAPGKAYFLLVAPLVGMATVYFIVNTGLVAAAIALSSRESVRSVWHDNFLWSAPSYFISVAAAALAATLVWRTGYWLAPLASAPLFLTYHIYKLYMGRIENEQGQVKKAADLHLATVEALARAIDAKEQVGYTHISRLQLYASRLAQSLGLPEVEVQGIRTAALLHDIGKLAVPEHILSKTGPLTDDEFQKVRIHPQIGADIIAGVPFDYPVAAVILGHHERWDGAGYPQGLRREAIPLGARILALVDYFDSITTERPDHRALSDLEATALIAREAGAALDPQLVGAFTELLPALLAETTAAEAASKVARHRATHAAAPGAAVSSDPRSAFENIALAHREIYVLYDIAQAMSKSLNVADTMALVSSKLSKIVPWSGCSLFLHDARTGLLSCAFEVGLDAPRLAVREMPSDGLRGAWTVSDRRVLFNHDPAATFEAVGLEARAELKSAMICPLYDETALIGFFAVYHAEPSRYSEDHRRLLERVAEQAGTVLRNAIVFEQTQEDALTDPLTGLPNRRWMSVHLAQELSRAQRSETEVAVIVLDLNNFKTINDTYGHNIGDDALRETAKALLAVCRPYDLCVRYAGDEFVLVLPNCTREAAELRRAEMQERLSLAILEASPGTLVELSASAGVSVFPQDGATYEALIATADHRMYSQKATSRQPSGAHRAVGGETHAMADA